jgi:hypothetical protein
MQLGLTLGLFALMLIVGFYSYVNMVGFWSAMPFMIAGALGLTLSFNWYDLYTDAFGLSVSLILLALSIYIIALSFRAMVKKDDE